MKHILFLTDFSSTAENAFVYALSTAKGIAADVFILHIAPVIPPADEKEAFTVHPLAKMVNEQVEGMEWGKFRKESRVLENIAKEHGLDDIGVEFHLRDGYFTEVVADFVDENDINLVVVGTAGNNTVERKLFGTHTEQLLKVLEVPVMAVPDKATYNPLDTYAAAVMLTSEEIPMISDIAVKLSVFHKQLRCVHIVKSAADYEAAKAKVGPWLENFPSGSVSAEIRINKDIIGGLRDYAQEKNIGTLCTIHRKLPFFKRLFTRNISIELLTEKTAVLIF